MNPTDYFLNTHAFPMIVTAVATLFLGIFVFANERGSAESRFLLVVTLIISLWLAAFSLMYCSNNEATALRWARKAYLLFPFFPAAIYHFTVVVLKLPRRFHNFAALGWAASGGIWFLMDMTQQLIEGVYHYEWGYYPKYGWLGWPFLVFFFTMMSLSLRHYWTEYRLAGEGAHKKRTQYFLIAFLIASLGSFDYLAKYGVPIYPFGFIFVLAAVMVLVWTIWHYHLVDLTPAFAAEIILGTMNGAVFVTDMEKKIRVVNRFACQMLGYDEAALVGKPLTIVRPKNTAIAEEAEWKGEFRDKITQCASKTGTKIDINLSSSILRDNRNNPVGQVFVALDLTGIRRAETALRESEILLQDILDHSLTVT